MSGDNEAPVDAGGNVFAVRARTQVGYETLLIVAENGNSWQKGTVTCAHLTTGNIGSSTHIISYPAGAATTFLTMEETSSQGDSTVGIDFVQRNATDNCGRIETRRLGADANYVMAFYGWRNGTSGPAVERMILDNTGSMLINDTLNAKMTIGLTINQGVYDDEILAFKASEVGHTMTDDAEEDTYFTIGKVSPTTGGAWLKGYNTTNYGVLIDARHATVETGKTSGANASIMLRGSLQTANTVGAMSANANIVTMQNYTSSVWICDKEGDTWQSGSITLGSTTVTEAQLIALLALL
jgi:hypothetical protein